MSCPGCTRRRLLSAVGLALPLASAPSVGSEPSPPGVSWTREYGDVASFDDAAPAHGGGAVLVGRVRAHGPASTRAWIVSLDDAGAVRWQRRLGPAGRTEFHSVVRTDGGYAVGGVRRPESEREPAGWLALLGRDGTLLNQATRRDRGPVDRTEIVADEDGFVLAGAEPTAETATTWVAGFDEDATERWSARYRRTYSLDALLRTPDGPVVVGTRVGQTAGAGDPWLAAFDADGREQWSTVVDVEGWRGVAAASTTDGGFLLALSGNRLLRLDGERTVVWRRDLPDFEHGLPTTAERVDDGYRLGGVDGRNGVVVAAIDDRGSTRWSHAYGGTPDHELAAMVDRGAGRYLLAGRIDGRPANGRRRGWAAALSPDASATTLGEATRGAAWAPTTTEAPATTTATEPASTTTASEPATATPGQSGFGALVAVVAAVVAVGLSRWRSPRTEW